MGSHTICTSTDRGVNYTTDPNENDGRLFELKLVKVP
jgi:hypothetical protein